MPLTFTRTIIENSQVIHPGAISPLKTPYVLRKKQIYWFQVQPIHLGASDELGSHLIVFGPSTWGFCLTCNLIQE